MSDERLYLVTYDISSPRRWRRVFRLMHGFGDWVQLSVFQCRLTRLRRTELETRLREIIKQGDDHVLIVDVGPADKVKLAVESLGRPHTTVERDTVVI